MEMHSYAKKRVLKKWTIEQKRKLVKARIANDAWFTNKSSSLIPWKNVLMAAHLDEFNVFFVRKQWSNMLTRYKQYKQTRLSSNIDSKGIDAELIKRITQEWEFFEPIHKFMTRKTTNLHSYAIRNRTDSNNCKQQEIGVVVQNLSNSETENHPNHHCRNKKTIPLLNTETTTINLSKDCTKENIPNNTKIVNQSNNSSQVDRIHFFSSDTSNDCQIIPDANSIVHYCNENQSGEYERINYVRNTDHDFYSKKSSSLNIDMERKVKNEEGIELQKPRLNYYEDASEESRDSSVLLVDLAVGTVGNPTNSAYGDNLSPVVNKTKSENGNSNLSKDTLCGNMPSTSTQCSRRKKRSEREKYYRHKRRYNRRLEKRFDAFLSIMCEFAKKKLGNVEFLSLATVVHPLVAEVNKALSSDSEMDSKSENSD